MHKIKIIKRADVARIGTNVGPVSTQDVVSRTNVGLAGLRDALLSTSRRALQEQRDKDLAVFGTEGRLGEILCHYQK